MGYTLRIGELKTVVNDGDGLESTISNTCDLVHLDNAPAFGEPTDYENQRWPSYSSWSDAMQICGLYEFMFDRHEGLLRNHPGCFPLVKEHKEVLDKAYKDFYLKHPNSKANFEDENNNINGAAVRLEWLKFWFDWAFENCKVPVFYNS